MQSLQKKLKSLVTQIYYIYINTSKNLMLKLIYPLKKNTFLYPQSFELEVFNKKWFSFGSYLFIYEISILEK